MKFLAHGSAMKNERVAERMRIVCENDIAMISARTDTAGVPHVSPLGTAHGLRL